MDKYRKNTKKMIEVIVIDDSDDDDDEDLAISIERNFSQILWDLFEKDLDVEDTDRRIPEEVDSLMDDDRTFLLNCLTGSPSFGYFHRQLAELQRLHTDVPERRVFIWLTHVLYWITRLQEASLPNGTFREGDAKQLIAAGVRVFQNIPDDVQKQFGKHRVHVAVKRNDIEVWSREGGARVSPGVVCLRWCAVLLEALKSDYERLLEWKQLKKNLCAKIDSIFAHRNRDCRNPNVVNTLYDCEQELWRLEHEEQDMVVRAPKEAATNVHSMVKRYLEKHASDEIRRDYAVKKYGTTDAVGPYREILLDALLVRMEAYGSFGRLQKLAAQEDDEKKKNVSLADCPRRKKIRLRFFEAFWKRLVSLPDDINEPLYSLCRWKAWEVEESLYDKWTDNRGDTNQHNYYAPARLLAHSIEDPKSSLFIRVLSGEIPTDELTNMSADELANPVVRQERQAALALAKAQLNLAKPDGLKGDREKYSEISAGRNAATDATPAGTKGFKTEGRKPSKNDRKDEDIFHKPVRKPCTLTSESFRAMEITNDTRQLHKQTGSLRGGGASPTGACESPQAKKPKLSMKEILATIPAKAKEPPALTMGNTGGEFLSAPAAAANAFVFISNMIRNVEGNQLFHFSFKNTRNFDFDALLERHMDADNITNAYLPQVFSLKGECQVEETRMFLTGKMKNTRYSHFSVRVKPQASDVDQYKKFYHHYELNDKIAMFSLPGEGTKAFLITPKYHGIVLAALSLPHAHGTYLIGYKAKQIVLVDLS